MLFRSFPSHDNTANQRIEAKQKEQADLLKIEAETQEKIKRQQKLAIYSQLAIDTASAIGSLVKYSEGNPANLLTGGVAGQIQLSAGLITIFANIAKAKSQIKQLRKGGKLTGKTHDQGGIPLYEAEGNEFVINSKDTLRTENTLNAINKGKDLQHIQRALELDFGQNVLKDYNISMNYDSHELKKELQKNNKNLEKLISLTENKENIVSVNNEVIKIGKNSIQKIKIK